MIGDKEKRLFKQQAETPVSLKKPGISSIWRLKQASCIAIALPLHHSLFTSYYFTTSQVLTGDCNSAASARK